MRFMKELCFQDDAVSLNTFLCLFFFFFFHKLKQSDTEFFALELLLQVTYCVLIDVAWHSRSHFQHSLQEN